MGLDEPNADYTLCKDDRKEIHWNVCKHFVKDTLYYCNLKKGMLCPAHKEANDFIQKSEK